MGSEEQVTYSFFLLPVSDITLLLFIIYIVVSVIGKIISFWISSCLVMFCIAG